MTEEESRERARQKSRSSLEVLRENKAPLNKADPS